MKTVNELSGTIDLESTLIRAEALFKRFHRLVEAIDKKGNFPSAPRLRAGKSSETSAEPEAGESSTGSTTGTDAGSAAAAKSPAKKDDAGKRKEDETKVITPELRRLLSRTVEVLPRKEVVGKGDGFQAK